MATIRSIINGFLGLKKDPTATTQDVAVIKAEDTNAGIVLKPNGTGAIMASVPDGTATGGNARGNGAVDLSLNRTSNISVASGINSTISGGYNNRASGSSSSVGGGDNNIASASYSCVGGGTQNNVSNDFSTISGGFSNIASSTLSTISGGQNNTASTNTHATVVGGYSNTASGGYSIAGGWANTASGTYSIAIGRGNTASGLGAVAIGGGYGSSGATASGEESFAMGQGALANNIQSFAFGSNQKAYLHHGFVHGFTRFAKGQGQYQDTTVQNEGSLSSAGTLSLLKDSAYPLQGSGLIPDGTNRAWNVTVKWVAVCTETGSGTTAVGDVAIATDSFMFKKVSGTSSIGSVQNLQNSQDATMAGATCSYAVGGSQDLQITFTAPASANATTFRVVAKVELTEVSW